MPDKPNIEEVLNVPDRVLLSAGPSNLPPRVTRALSLPMLSHLDPEFMDIMSATSDLLRQVFQTSNEATLLIPGTGSAGMEAAFANVVEPGDRVLVAVSGYFGARMVEVATRLGGVVTQVKGPIGGAVDEEEFIKALNSDDFKVAAAVHAETSTGAMQPVEKIGAACREQETLLLVDTVTSLGGMDVRVDDWGIDVCYSGSQKCLSIPPGVSPITFSEKAMRKVRNRSQKTYSYYLDVLELLRYWEDRTYHHTASIPLLYASFEALNIILEEGLEARFERHRNLSERLIREITPLGFKPFVEPELRLTMISCVLLPPDWDDLQMRTRLRREWNIEVDGGLGETAGKVWRIGLKGHSATARNLAYIVWALRELSYKDPGTS